MASAGNVQVSVVEGRHLKPPQPEGTASPYVALKLGAEEAQTDPAENTLFPKWVKDFKLKVSEDKPPLEVTVIDKETGTTIGSTTISMSEILKAGTTVKWHSVVDAEEHEAGDVCMVLRYMKPKASSAGAGSRGALTSNGATASSADSHDASSRGRPASSDPADSESESQPNRIAAVGGSIIAAVLAIFLIRKRASKPKYYEVRRGDTLCSIADRYGCSDMELYDYNISVTDDPDRIYPGDRIFIPK